MSMSWSEGETAVAPNGKLPELVCESFDVGSRRRWGVHRRAVWHPEGGRCGISRSATVRMGSYRHVVKFTKCP